MKKSKLYLILAIVTAVILFATAAICNQCSQSEELTPPPEEPPEEPEPPGEKPTEEELSAPTIDLEIYEGPLYSEADGVCYYRVKAIVTGNPKPEVEFNRDDSSGAWSDDNIKRAQVNLSDPGEIFTLTATATNSEGDASDSIEITWGCEEEPTLEGLEPELELTVLSITFQPEHVGYAIKNDGANNNELIIGDSVNNQDVKGFFSFNVTPLAGKTINSAMLVLKLPEGVEGFGLLGDPSFKGIIKILLVGYPIPLESGHYSAGGPCVIFSDFSNVRDPIKYSDFISVIDRVSDSGDLLPFQIIYDNPDSNGDHKIDGRRYRKEDISLIVWYEE